MPKLSKAAFGLAVSVCLTLTSFAPAHAQPETYTVRQASPTGSYVAGMAALDRLDAKSAARLLMQAAEAEWDNPHYSGRAFLAYLLLGRVADAAAIAQHLVDIDPQNELARLTLGAVALKQRRYNSASQELGRIPNETLIGVTSGILDGWAHIGNNDVAGAYGIMGQLGELGFDEFLIFHRAIMSDVAGDRDAALGLSRAAYEADPFVPRIAEAYVRILANAGQFDEAQAVLASYAAEGTSHPLLDVLAEPVAEGRRPGLFASSVQAGAAEVLHGLGSAIARDGSTELGAIFLQLARYLDPDATIVAMTLGELLSGAERYEESSEVYASIAPESALYVNALVRQAENLDLADRREEAVTRLRNIVVRYPDNLEALGALGDILRYDEQWGEASDAYSQLIAQIVGDRAAEWRYFYVRGITYERSGQWELAEADLLKALELNPEQPYVLNYLGYSWVDQGLYLDDALDMIDRAIAILPRDGYIIDSLGWAYYKLGRVDEAIVELERALRFLPNDPEINDHLGDAYWVAGREREAMFQWRIAIDVDERGVVTERAAPKLIGGLDPDAPIPD
ncbi:tetratricopeptide repeat protein [Pelagibacterium sediminicola]|uniref:tetratricopeptide repeat protein n=1 Tax=Pelagibacterium sediminicola TaxID=2248761 RepID=UPI000E31FE64|nr:tetratricopeptide repeat protein [Pelagibacterium sediminicola]